MNTISYFEIQSSYPPREVQFYENVFGWKFQKVEGLTLEYYQIITDGISGGLLARPAKVPPLEYGTNAFVNSIEVQNFDVCQAEILKNGGIVAMPKFAIPNKCWQGYFIDQDNNIFGIVQIDPLAK